MNTKEKIEAAWLRRAEAMDLNHKHLAYKRAECDFFAGAIAAIDAADTSPRPEGRLSNQVPLVWIIDINIGNPIVKGTKK